MTRATHRAFGLNWAMPFEFPPYTAVTEVLRADVTVLEGAVPQPPFDGHWAGPLSSIEEGSVTIAMPGAARMHISDGNRIVFQREDDWTPEELRLLLMGPGAALVLHQRGLLPLHGSGIVTEKGAILVVGHSGAGKSTVLGALMDRGLPVLCDDLAAVHVDSDGRPWVSPGTRVMKVWADSAESLGWTTSDLPRVRPGFEKFIVPVTHQVREAMPLVAVYQMTAYSGPTVELEPRRQAAKFNAILDHTWQKMTLKGMARHGEHFRLAIAVASTTRVVSVRRPDGVPIGQTDLVDRILRDLREHH